MSSSGFFATSVDELEIDLEIRAVLGSAGVRDVGELITRLRNQELPLPPRWAFEVGRAVERLRWKRGV